MAPPRADARLNRESLLRAAAQEFAHAGPDVALDRIARAASVSIATLYRHFPTRAALVAETYRAEIAHLGDVDALLGRPDGPVSGTCALSTWLGRLVGHARTKRALSGVLHSLPDPERPGARDLVVGALEQILARGAADGTLRVDVDADDVLTALAGLWTLPDDERWTERADRLVRLVVDGLTLAP